MNILVPSWLKVFTTGVFVHTSRSPVEKPKHGDTGKEIPMSVRNSWTDGDIFFHRFAPPGFFLDSMPNAKAEDIGELHTAISETFIIFK